MNAKTSIARIRLPNHHPAVQGLKKGGVVKLHAVREDTEDDVPMTNMDKSQKSMPLERGFHVTKIEPANVGREPSEDQREAVKAVTYLKGRQSVKGGGRAVS